MEKIFQDKQKLKIADPALLKTHKRIPYTEEHFIHENTGKKLYYMRGTQRPTKNKSCPTQQNSKLLIPSKELERTINKPNNQNSIQQNHW